MRYEYQVTKYDPALRDASGRFTGNEWTAMSDVGRRFGGRVLKMREYLATEAKYLRVLAAMLAEAEVSRLELRDLELHGFEPSGRWRQGESLTIPRAVEFARLALREELWGRLVAPRRAFVHFGYDYYMYVGLSRRTPRALLLAGKRKIFVEPCPSPNHSERVLQRRARQ